MFKSGSTHLLALTSANGESIEPRKVPVIPPSSKMTEFYRVYFPTLSEATFPSPLAHNFEYQMPSFAVQQPELV